MKKCLTFFFVFTISFPLFTQDFNAWKQKYWVYRERLKNFMVSNSSQQGCSIPALGRDNSGQIGWGDSPWMMGYWVGTLAMEYKLLSHSGADVSQTKEDLFNAIDAINRIDCLAEWAWGCGNYDCVPQQLNGFMIRDDVPNFLHTTIEDQFNQGWVPPHDGWRAKCVNSAYTSYLNPGGEASQDHLIGLFVGLSLVKKCITNVNESWGIKQFSDEETSFVREVQNISNRITTYLYTGQGNGNYQWYYINACQYRCVQGIHNPKYDNPCTNTPSVIISNTNPCIADIEGAIAFPQAIGFAEVNNRIQSFPNGSSHAGFAGALFSQTVNDQALRVAWRAALINGSRLPLTLEALGGIGDVVLVGICPACTLLTDSKETIAKHLVNRGKSQNWEHLILLNRLLHGNQYDNSGLITISNNHYTCLLDAAPCRGFEGLQNSGQIPEWSCHDRLDGSRACTDVSVESTNGLAYMFYFNLFFSVAVESGNYTPYQYEDFTPIPIKNIAPVDVIKSPNGYVELDKKNFMASNNIWGQNYEITTDAVSGDQGRVTFVAGNKIILSHGFKVTNGGYFHGYIDPAISPMTCVAGTGDCSAVYKETSFDSSSFGYDTLFVQQNPPPPQNEITEQKSAFVDYNISIIPNPSTGIFTLICKDALQSIEVIDMLGNAVFKKAVNNQPVNMDVDISSHPRGIYFIKVQTSDNIFTEKIILQ